MNEVINLSNDLNVITAEINSYKQVAGQSIFEIGRRLKHVKENDLVHGEFGKWLETIDMDKSQASRFIKIASELEDSNLRSSANIGFKALYEISTMPQEERTKQHEIPSTGETKMVDEMTVRELREVKKKLKQEQQAREQAQKSEQIALRKLEEAENKEPVFIEKEVFPDDYDKLKGGYEALERTRDFYKKQSEELREELNKLSDSVKNNGEVDDSNYQELKQKEERLKTKINESHKLYDLQNNLEQMISVLSPKEHIINFEKIGDQYELLNDFETTLNEVINICESFKGKLPNGNIIEGEIIDEI